MLIHVNCELHVNLLNNIAPRDKQSLFLASQTIKNNSYKSVKYLNKLRMKKHKMKIDLTIGNCLRLTFP